MTKKKDEKFDSTQHLEERKAAIEEENKTIAEDKEIAVSKALPQPGETREQLLERVRAMRDEKPAVVETELVRSEAQQKEFNLEQEAGRALVAKATAIQEKYQALLAEEAKGEKNPAG